MLRGVPDEIGTAFKQLPWRTAIFMDVTTSLALEEVDTQQEVLACRN